MKTGYCFLIIMFVLLSTYLFAAKTQDQVKCKDGSVYTGDIISNVINQSVVIQTEYGMKQIPYNEIVSIDKVTRPKQPKKLPFNLVSLLGYLFQIKR